MTTKELNFHDVTRIAISKAQKLPNANGFYITIQAQNEAGERIEVCFYGSEDNLKIKKVSNSVKAWKWITGLWDSEFK